MADPQQAAKLDLQSLQQAVADVRQQGVSAEAAKDSAKLLELANQAPVVRLVDQVLSEAVARHASDVHIEAFEDHVLIRYRIDGICYEVARAPRSLVLAIASRIKILSNLDVAESRLPQDGRILITRENRQIDLRVSTLPTIFGESIVLRVLDKGALDKTLNQLGMDEATQRTIEEVIKRPHGLLLVTGPTGSGKTTTLYACLTTLNRPDVKIITTEDPVEYDIAGLVQVAINQKIDLNFAACLRAILRHDPDIIMVGEIRDPETAIVAIQASLTGHLVLSTLHTNDAPGAVTRLLDMKLEPFLITSTVHAVLAQRLIRRLCPQCASPREVTDKDREELGVAADVPVQLKQPVGCDACHGLGFQGRAGIYELMVMHESVRTMVLERKSLGEIRAAARAHGMRTLREDGIAKVLAGETTLEEVMRETQIDG